MTIKSQNLIDPENLAIRARRGELTEDEQRALQTALMTDGTLAVAHQLGCDFDAALRTRPGDDAMIARVTQRALAVRDRRALRPRSRVSIRVAVLAAIVSIAASAAVIVHRQRVRHPDHDLLVVPARVRQAPATSAGSANPDVVKPAMAPVPTPEVPSAPLIPHRAASKGAALVEREVTTESSGAPRAAPAAEPDAVQLFREAGEARREGNVSRATALYRELQAKFPQSSEARVSRVSLAKLLLAAGRASEARQLFDVYLAEGGQALREEAMVGRADAFASLGDPDQERQIWQQLLRSYPASVYAARARQRLQQLAARDAVDSR